MTKVFEFYFVLYVLERNLLMLVIIGFMTDFFVVLLNTLKLIYVHQKMDPLLLDTKNNNNNNNNNKFSYKSPRPSPSLFPYDIAHK